MWNWILVKAALGSKKELRSQKISQDDILRLKSHTQDYHAPCASNWLSVIFMEFKKNCSIYCRAGLKPHTLRTVIDEIRSP